MRYLLGGYYGMRNVGDDVLLYVTLAEVARLDSTARFTVLSELPEAVPPGARVRLAAGGRRLENVRQMLAHDVWLFGGGGLLQDGSPRAVDSLVRLGRAARVVKLLGRRIALLGIGVGPLRTKEGRAAARQLLDYADFVTVRDEESQVLTAMVAPDVSVHLTGDLAFLFPRHVTPARPQIPRTQRTVGISLLPYASSLGQAAQDDEQRTVAMAKALRQVLERHRDWNVMLFEFFSGSPTYGDARVLRDLESQLGLGDRVTYRPYDGDFESVYSDLAACDAFVGMRFHSCLLAHTAGVPCLMLAYHPKSESLAARLRLDADAVAPLPVLNDPVALAARVETLLTDSTKFRPSVPIETMAVDSERNFTLLSSWLKGSQAERIRPADGMTTSRRKL